MSNEQRSKNTKHKTINSISSVKDIVEIKANDPIRLSILLPQETEGKSENYRKRSRREEKKNNKQMNSRALQFMSICSIQFVVFVSGSRFNIIFCSTVLFCLGVFLLFCDVLLQVLCTVSIKCSQQCYGIICVWSLDRAVVLLLFIYHLLQLCP